MQVASRTYSIASLRRLTWLVVLLLALLVAVTAQAQPSEGASPSDSGAEAGTDGEAQNAGPSTDGGVAEADAPTAVVTPGEDERSASTEQRLREIRTQVDVLKENTFATKSRLLLLRESVLRRSIAGSRLMVIHRDDMGSEFKLEQVLYALDRAPKFERVNEKKGLSKLDDTIVVDEKVVPGNHLLTIVMVFRGNDWFIFRYMDGYAFTVRSSYPFVAEEGKAHEIIVQAYEDGDFLTPLEERPTVSFAMKSYDLARSTAAAPTTP